jgi:cytoskeletal protein CcmA (bactofilin family)
MRATFPLWSLLALHAGLAAHAAEYRTGDKLSLEGQFDDNLFASGGRIDATFSSTDDAYLAGGEVRFEAATKEDLFLAGGDVDVRGAKAGLAAIAGGSITVSRSSFRELLVAGGEVSLDDARLRDDLVAAGGEVSVGAKTRVGGSSTIGGGSVELEGTFAGNVRVEAGELEIGPATVIEGDLIYSAQKVEIDPAARIRGKTIAAPVEARSAASWILGAFFGVLFSIGALLAAPVILAFTPKLAAHARSEARGNFWPTLGKGTAAALLIPVAMVALLASVVGTPVGLAALPFAFAALVLAASLAAFIAGEQLRTWFGKGAAAPGGKAQFRWTLFGAFALILLSAIPVLGTVLVLIAVLLGYGTLYAVAQKALSKR